MMQCEDVVNVLSGADGLNAPDTREALDHLKTCAECCSALVAVDALHQFRSELVTVPSDGAFERMVRDAVRSGPAARYRTGFWRGAAFGAALAAGVASVAVGLWLRQDVVAPAAVPEVRLALNEPRDVTVALETAEPLAAAEVHVVLSGAVGLQGYDRQRELRWSTDLARGVNELTLPVVLFETSGGQLLVEVLHGDKRRTFVVDVRANAEPIAAPIGRARG
jgi:hypothetical protein